MPKPRKEPEKIPKGTPVHAFRLAYSGPERRSGEERRSPIKDRRKTNYYGTDQQREEQVDLVQRVSLQARVPYNFRRDYGPAFWPQRQFGRRNTPWRPFIKETDLGRTIPQDFFDKMEARRKQVQIKIRELRRTLAQDTEKLADEIRARAFEWEGYNPVTKVRFLVQYDPVADSYYWVSNKRTSSTPDRRNVYEEDRRGTSIVRRQKE